MKKTMFILLAIVLAFSSCKKSKCELAVCNNGGYCEESTGNCVCINGYSGPNCSASVPLCAQYHTGSLTAYSSHNDPYNIYLDNVYKETCSAYGSKTVNNISTGYYNFKAVQASGYILYPTEYTASINITDCTNANVSF